MTTRDKLRHAQAAYETFLRSATAVMKDIELNAGQFQCKLPGVLVIQQAVAIHYKLELRSLYSAARPVHLVRARHVAMYLARDLTGHSLDQVAQAFCRDDHGTVMHAVKRIENDIATIPAFARELAQLRETCRISLSHAKAA